MYLLELTPYSVDYFVEEMLVGRHDNEKNKYLKTRFLSIIPKLIDEEKKYQELARNEKLHQITKHDSISLHLKGQLNGSIPQIITSAEMSKLYSSFFVGERKSTSKSREVYNAIMANTSHNLCPYCSHRDVKTVDHYLPKSKYTLLSIVPANLLPCCSDCNKDKGEDVQLTKNKMLIHPYFDKVEHLDWLNCEVVKNEWPITFTYAVSDDIEDDTLKARIAYQFNLLKLDVLYADNATREFNKRVKTLVNEYNSQPENNALTFIEDNIESYKLENKNSWQTKMFEALKKSDWFQVEVLPQLEEEYVNKRM